MKNIKFVAKEHEKMLYSIPELSLFAGDSVNLNLEAEFSFDRAVVYCNGFFVGNTKTGQIAINASKLNEGVNELKCSFLDAGGKVIADAVGVIVKEPRIENEEENASSYSNLARMLGEQKIILDDLLKWKEQIDKERSGYDG